MESNFARTLCQPRALVRPFVLLALAEEPGHGYDLAARLKELGYDWAGPGPLYYELRDLERRGFVTSSVAPGAAGPSRRVYELTSAGWDALADCMHGMSDLTLLVRRYEARASSVMRCSPRARGPEARAASSDR